MSEYLFVYGTLMRRIPGLGRHGLLARHGAYRGGAAVAGRLYDVGSYPALAAGGEGRVVGELYRLRRPAAALRLLDRYEGCRADGRGEYRRVRRTVRRDRGGTVIAWVYLYNRPVAPLRPIAGGDYRAWLPHRGVDLATTPRRGI